MGGTVNGRFGRLSLCFAIGVAGAILLGGAGRAPAAPIFSITSLGFKDAEHTGPGGTRESFPRYVNASGQVAGSQTRYVPPEGPLGQTAWFYDGSALLNVGLTDAEHTGTNAYRYSWVTGLNAAGQVVGGANRYDAAGNDVGVSAWLYNGTTTQNVGLTDPEHTRVTNEYRHSWAIGLNAAGQVAGWADRYDSAGNHNGASAWLYNGTTTLNIGLTDPEHTRATDGTRISWPNYLNDAGQVVGSAFRYDGAGNDLGASTWLYNGTTTLNIGLTDPEHTRVTDGYRSSWANNMNAAGQAAGWSARYDGAGNYNGSSIWLYNGTTTFNVGPTDLEHTRVTDNRRYADVYFLNAAGQVAGQAERYDGAGNYNGWSTWLYNGTTTLNVGPTDPEHTRAADGYRESWVAGLNAAGRVVGVAYRYDAAGNDLGETAWLYNGTTTLNVGLTDPEHTAVNEYRSSYPHALNDAGWVAGTAIRFDAAGTGYLGQSAWLYNGTATLNVGLADPMRTRADGFRYSSGAGIGGEDEGNLLLNALGQVAGQATRYNGGETPLGYSAWMYDPGTDTTYPFDLSTRSDGYAYSEVTWLGDNGLVLGQYQLFDALDTDLGLRPFYFTVAGGLHDLGSLVDGGLAANGWDFLQWTISPSGEYIAGSGEPSPSDPLAFLLSPVQQQGAIPEPATLTLLGLGGLALLARRRRSRKQGG
ncbi:MAG TPA: PEP-CTERM sorting domain-containing protein [Planctomycetota bacterium]|nr:PEP-CTERM sorting domain-containing protein [Planctomycetota bacterium]HRR81975.1 PEP-CTERM sorting domain-containing protein [Planctomycetota bacterium]HRT94872.1 PEP-CTERM sorting domain-containing protein [Planctomycetota bacterium]